MKKRKKRSSYPVEAQSVESWAWRFPYKPPTPLAKGPVSSVIVDGVRVPVVGRQTHGGPSARAQERRASRNGGGNATANGTAK